MGFCFSCKSTTELRNIRVVHLNGHVEDFEFSVSVSEVTAKRPKHFVSHATQLLSTASKPLKPDTQLQAGQIYFLLPLSILQADVSPVEFAAVARRLVSIAKSTRSQTKSWKHRPFPTQNGSRSPVRSPNRFVEVVEANVLASKRSWKPILDTIREEPLTWSESEVIQKMKYILRR